MGNQPVSGAPEATAQNGGFRILKVHRGTEAERVRFEELFDFVVSVQDVPVAEGQVLNDYFQQVQGDTARLGIYNPLRRHARAVKVRRPEHGGPFRLGARCRYEEFGNALRNCLHVTCVLPDSPAAQLGFQSDTDYILSTVEGLALKDPETFALAMRDAANRKVPLGLMVFNSESSKVREVMLGLNVCGEKNGLGLEVAHGFAHGIKPAPATAVSSQQSSVGSASPEGAESPFKVETCEKLGVESPEQMSTVEMNEADYQKLLHVASFVSPSLQVGLGGREMRRREMKCVRAPCFASTLLLGESVKNAGGVGQVFLSGGDLTLGPKE